MIPDDEAIIVATNKGVPVVMDEKSKAGRAFRDVATHHGEDVPIAATAEKIGLPESSDGLQGEGRAVMDFCSSSVG